MKDHEVGRLVGFWIVAAMIVGLMTASAAHAQTDPNAAEEQSLFQLYLQEAAIASERAAALQTLQEYNQLKLLYLQQLQNARSGNQSGSGSSISSSLTPYTAFYWQQGPGGLIRADCTQDPTSEGKAVAALLVLRPAGQRVVFFWQSTPLIWGQDFIAGTTTQSPWMVNGSRNASAWITTFCASVKAANASIDFAVDDDEGNLSIWGSTQAKINTIASDSRFALIAQAYGLPDASHAEDLHYYLTQGQAWNAAMAGIINGYLHSGFYTPLAAAFPNVGYSNFANFVVPQSLMEDVRDNNGWPYWYPEPLVGSHQAPTFYGQVAQLATRNDGTKANFVVSYMPTLCWEINTARVVGSGSGHPSVPWFSCQSYTSYLKNNQGYAESIYHILMSLGTTNLFLWNPPPATAADNQAVTTALANLKTELGGATSWKVMTTSYLPYNSTTITTTIQIGTKTISRVTTPYGGTWVTTGN